MDFLKNCPCFPRRREQEPQEDREVIEVPTIQVKEPEKPPPTLFIQTEEPLEESRKELSPPPEDWTPCTPKMPSPIPEDLNWEDPESTVTV
jgi:hypothetical protein